MTKRKKTNKTKEETEVLTKSLRRCAICFGLKQDSTVKKGQIAHLDRKPSNNEIDNLVFLCLEHHDDYDIKPSQSKRFAINEVKEYRTKLYEYLEKTKSPWIDHISNDETKNGKDVKRFVCSPEVYEYKIAIYRSFRKLFVEIIQKGTISLDSLRDFAQETDEAIFLFDTKMADYLREIYRKAIQLRYFKERLISDVVFSQENKEKVADEAEKLFVWFEKQYEIARRKFSKFIFLG